MARLTTLTPDDPKLAELLGSAHARFQRLVAEADERARPFYAAKLGRAMGCEEAIAEIFDAVDHEGDAAIVRYSELFDGSALAPAQLRVTEQEIEAAWASVEPALREALTTATEAITTYQQRLLPHSFGTELDEPLGVRWTPLDRVGAYVPGGPGGSLPLCSTVLMNLVPAKVAGVPELVLVTPPRADGSVAPELLAAAKAAGVTEIYKVGGVQAIAALACGSASIPRVDKIVGPGNIFVTLAKRQAYGRVDIDMLAGPSEVMVIADSSCNPAWIAADLLSQAEHDQLAMAVLLTVEPGIDVAIQVEVERQLAALPEQRRVVAEASIDRMGLCVPCTSLDQAVSISNRYGAEHLEILLADPKPAVAAIRHAGAIFVGGYSPEPIGDYVAGPSHTLPTGGTARMWSGIGTDTFMKRSSIINLDRAGFEALAPHAVTLARAEGLEAHARALEARLNG
ncbi:MAG: histidinol dehydrogenase [Planctomycetota bacterium]|jgi:histidinol dehydrogenase|nr:histidinol dehydrogenase [Planctomycetota bacterium]